MKTPREVLRLGFVWIATIPVAVLLYVGMFVNASVPRRGGYSSFR